ncbi:MAG: hypothetical protein KC417_16665 [Myxococcales bacterium]|nr:hypothetical protein [Myxococcales bacterium]
MAFYSARNFEDALNEFRASVTAYPSPNAQLAVARCLRDMGRLPEAVLEYEKAVVLASERIAEQPNYRQARDAAQEELRLVASSVGRVRIVLDPRPSDLEMTLNGEPLPAAALDRAWPVLPGRFELLVRANGYREGRVVAEVRAGAEAPAVVALVPEHGEVAPTVPVDPAADGGAPEDEVTPGGSATLEYLAWGATGLAAASAVVFVISYVLASGKQDDFTKSCIDAVCPASRRDDLRSTGNTYESMTNISFGVGLVSVAAAVTFFLLDWADATPGDAELSARPGDIGLGVRF